MTGIHCRAPGVWVPPRPVGGAGPAPNGRKRALAPPTDSMQTHLLSDGWYLGNDLHSVDKVWELLGKIEEWVASNPSSLQAGWHTKSGIGKQERLKQERLRGRRRVVWEAIKAAAVDEGASHEDVVRELQQTQSALDLGISRIEAWAQVARKQGKSILASAREYCEGRRVSQTRARTVV